MKSTPFFRMLIASGLLLGACHLVNVECDQECRDGWLDSGNFPDECLDTVTVKCRVSDRLPAPTDAQKESLQVVIAIHGYTASSFEWKEFADFIDTMPEYADVAVSRIVLGGHGQDIDAFQASTWRMWGAPILAEYDSLQARGYKHISFACASTGCALLMQHLNDGAFEKRQAPKWIFMIDPIVVPTQKILSLASIVGPILGNSPNPGTAQENRHWYVNRPQETLQELYDLINRVKNELEDGFKLPRGTQAKVYKSLHDNNADPVGALLIYKGLREWDGSHLEVEMEDSRLHVFTRLEARSSPPSPERRALQVKTFREMAERVLKP